MMENESSTEGAWTRDCIRRSLEHIVGAHFSAGNRITALHNGENIFPSMLEAIEQTRESIDFLTFVYWKGEIAQRFGESLTQAARRGVRVRVLLDAYGAMPMDRKLVSSMREAGADVRWFRPIPTWKIWNIDNRTHRKLLICDRRVGFTGGVGIAKEWEGNARNPDEWRDTHFRLEGPALAGLSGAFYQNWSEVGHTICHEDVTEIANDPEPRGPGSGHDAEVLTLASSASPGWTDFAMLVQCVFALAKRRLWITTPYFAPDESLEASMVEAVARGVEVKVLISGKHTDQRFQRFASEEAFERLLGHGIRFAYYQKTMLHQKLMIMDDQLVLAGSGNLNQRSMLKDDELNFVALSNDLVAELADDYEADWQHREDIDPERWKRRSWLQRLGERAAFFFRAEL